MVLLVGRLVTHAAVTRRGAVLRRYPFFFWCPRTLERKHKSFMVPRILRSQQQEGEASATSVTKFRRGRGECRFLFFVHPLPRDLTPLKFDLGPSWCPGFRPRLFFPSRLGYLRLISIRSFPGNRRRLSIINS